MSLMQNCRSSSLHSPVMLKSGEKHKRSRRKTTMPMNSQKSLRARSLNSMSKIKALKRWLGIQVKYYENVEYELRDKDGNIKPLFQLNVLGRMILKSIRQI